MEDLAYYQRRCEMLEKQRNNLKKAYEEKSKEVIIYLNMIIRLKDEKNALIDKLNYLRNGYDTTHKKGNVIQFRPRVVNS